MNSEKHHHKNYGQLSAAQPTLTIVFSGGLGEIKHDFDARLAREIVFIFLLGLGTALILEALTEKTLTK